MSNNDKAASPPHNVIDDAPMSKFHWRIAALSAGGPFLDGWVLSIIGVMLIQAQTDLQMSTLEVSLTGGAALAGMLVGGLFGGYLCDLLGRKITYTVDLVALVVGSILCAVVGDAWQLIVLRFVIGIAVGADYPIAASLLTEFVPRRRRGALLASLVTAWFIGSFLSYLVAFAISDIGEGSWRWMAASAALPGIVIVLLRRGIPESPRWLVSRGQHAKAEQILKRVFGPEARVADLDEPVTPMKLLTVLKQRGYVGRALFVIAFQSAQIVPLYAIYAFLPAMLEGFGFTGDNVGYIGGAASSAIVLVGAVVGTLYMDRWGRRPVLILPFIPMAGALLLLGLAPQNSMIAVVIGFSIYSIFSGITGLLVWSYPSELFPTEVRSTIIGLITATTRVAAAVGTFLVPLSLSGIGLGPTMLIGAVLTVFGLIVSLIWAPETTGRSLSDTSSLGSAAHRLDTGRRSLTEASSALTEAVSDPRVTR